MTTKKTIKKTTKKAATPSPKKTVKQPVNQTRNNAFKTTISVKGARVHNLKNVSVDIPKNQLVVFTGVSGSGKSSLAFDTIYAEGQRRYVESLSAYARQFLEQLDKPDVDSLEGLSPAISIDQKNKSNNPRSTVGTVTEIQDYLRLLFANIGTLYCPRTQVPVKKQSVQDMVNTVVDWEKGQTLLILSPLVKKEKGEFHTLFADLIKRGFVRVRVDGEIKRLEDCERLAKYKQHTIELVVDRMANTPDNHTRLFEAIELAVAESKGLLLVESVDTEASITCSESFASEAYQFSINELTPRLFSFNSPIGACQTCKGLGNRLVVDPSLLFYEDETLIEGIERYVRFSDTHYIYKFRDDAERMGLSFESQKTFKQLTNDERDFIYYGRYGKEIMFPEKVKSRFGWRMRPRGWEGVVNILYRRLAMNETETSRGQHGHVMVSKACEDCYGHRLNTEALSVKINGLSISQFGDLSIRGAKLFIQTLTLTDTERHIAKDLIKEISNRLSFLDNVGLHYLNLNRTASTLSGGEHQRIRLATQIGSGLTGVLYVLDEPSIGLHQRDNDQLIDTLKTLRDLGNTVIVVEHDEDTIKSADHIVDIGPLAGVLGGDIIHNGHLDDLLKNKASLTGQYLSQALRIDVPTQRRAGHKNQCIELFGAKLNNLKKVNISVPLGTLTCVTGVSGSGKSSLIQETLLSAIQKERFKQPLPTGPYTGINGLQHIDNMIVIDQSPIGRTPRSNPVTYVGVYSAIRDVFTALPESKLNGYKAGRFSFNVKGGRCETCEGAGVTKVDMHFLTDILVTCTTCRGRRFNDQTIRIKFKGHSISDVLNLTVNQAHDLFENIPKVHNKLRVLQEVGLGYITLGQSATTLSGGESQRIKLSKELSKRNTGQTLYLLDEPTTGLHFDDINRLLAVINRLVDNGNTAIVIEHNLDVIKCADYVIDLGPGGGQEGGRVVATGTPEDIAANKKSLTGRYLASYLPN